MSTLSDVASFLQKLCEVAAKTGGIIYAIRFRKDMVCILYRIVCRKRSNCLEWGSPEMTYWLPNRSGYTMNRHHAGLYTALELDECAGTGFDWVAERVER